MLRETLAELAPRPGGLYVDVTLGRGGHAQAILEASAPDGRLIGIDRDPTAIAETAPLLARFGARAQLRHGAFSELRAILAAEGAERVDGLLADLGASSPQLDDPARGFSFRTEGPLDMRMDPTRGETARELISRVSEHELANLIRSFGQERRPRAIARSIKRAEAEGRLATTGDLRRAIVRVTGPRRRGGIDPATRTFQAIRIAVNDELGQLDALLAAIPEVLADGGVAVVLSFHSLEDRAVKRAFHGDPRLVPTLKKPRVASEEERAENPRARSAKLRAARRVPRAAAAGGSL
jgi:16S rRNA (cytosine1402-N4)-methyltransferase